MKRTFLVLLLLSALLALSACGRYSESDLDAARSAGYADGKADGYGSGESDGYSLGYRHGYEEGFEAGASGGSVDSLVWEAEHYAAENGGWHPEEALCIIEDYENGTAKYFDAVPTVEEYGEAIHTLYYFYEFFYSR